MLQLTTAQADRAAGVLLGQAVGDALGVHYEFGTPPPAGVRAAMLGGGLINGAPGEWSDDTQMAVCVAQVAATGADLSSRESLDKIAGNFHRWYRSGPMDIGVQTRAVLAGTSAFEDAAAMTASAHRYARENRHSAGNGALMRTSPVALASLDDRGQTAQAARAVAELTHADPLAGDACVIWSEAIRLAVLEGRFQFTAGITLLPRERQELWRAWIDDACMRPPDTFRPNGFTVTALQAAVAAIAQTDVPRHRPSHGSFECLHLQESLHRAIRIGDDTDTVSAIAGGLLGARWGASAVPWHWRRLVHGWPGMRATDLVALATLSSRDGRPDDRGWPTCDHVRYEGSASSKVVHHPLDAGVVLGTMRSRDHDASAVVSLCRVGRRDHETRPQHRIESRLVDSDDPAQNPNLHFALYDVADAIRGLRAEEHQVLVHCVAAEQRTPAAAVAYAVLLGLTPEEAARKVMRALPKARGHGLLWEAAAEIGDPRPVPLVDA